MTNITLWAIFLLPSGIFILKLSLPNDTPKNKTKNGHERGISFLVYKWWMLFFFLKKVISFLPNHCWFLMPCIFSLCPVLIPSGSAELSVFPTLVGLIFGTAAVICFLSEEICKCISLFDGHSEHFMSVQMGTLACRAVASSDSFFSSLLTRLHDAKPQHHCQWVWPCILV